MVALPEGTHNPDLAFCNPYNDAIKVLGTSTESTTSTKREGNFPCHTILSPPAARPRIDRGLENRGWLTLGRPIYIRRPVASHDINRMGPIRASISKKRVVDAAEGYRHIFSLSRIEAVYC
jgi:hypothetical protein